MLTLVLSGRSDGWRCRWAIVLSGCIGFGRDGGGDFSDSCRCPNLEAVAPTIDWVGTAVRPESTQSSDGLDHPHRIDLHYPAASSSESARQDLQVAIDRLDDAGFLRLDASLHAYAGEDWLLKLMSSDLRLIVFVEIADDHLAESILRPLAEALGTVP